MGRLGTLIFTLLALVTGPGAASGEAKYTAANVEFWELGAGVVRGSTFVRSLARIVRREPFDPASAMHLNRPQHVVEKSR
jgi:hypothetical protein